jgi:hypothetical protein
MWIYIFTYPYIPVPVIEKTPLGTLTKNHLSKQSGNWYMAVISGTSEVSAGGWRVPTGERLSQKKKLVHIYARVCFWTLCVLFH